MSEPAAANPPHPPGDTDGGAARVASLPPNAPEVLPRKFGKYTLIRKLATGGMAELYLALHRSVAGFEKLVVIKRILPEMARDQAFITMLLTEARLAATFSHPNIVTLFDVGQADKTYFIAMEHIHGEDLRTIVRAMKPKSVTEFPIEHAIGIALGVAAGLSYAHDKRDLNGNALDIVHRDISPQNIIVTFTGDVKIVDFGIAKAARATDPVAVARIKEGDPNGDPEHNTKAGQLKGKVPYMSPEQARGAPLDGRSDIFSLGVILFELSTGRRLFRGGSEAETIKMITDGEYPRPAAVNPRISAALENIIMRALAKDVSKRYQHAREMQGDLEKLARHEAIEVSTLALGNWMQMLFEEKLASQREALLQGKQLADVIAADDPDPYTQAGSMESAIQSMPPAPPSRLPWIVAIGGLVAVIAVAGGLYFRQQRQQEEAAAEARAIRSGTIEVHSVPEGANIWLNEAPTQYRTPYTLRNLETGGNVAFNVKLTAEGFNPFVQDVPLPQRYAQAVVQARLERASAQSFAVLEVTTTPRGASVLVDGREIPGTTPLTVSQLAPGVEHTVLVRHPDTADETFRFVGQSGQIERRPLALHERPLAADEGWVNLNVEPNETTFRLNDHDYTNASPYHLRLHTDPNQRVMFTATGYEAEAHQIRVHPGETIAMTVRLAHAGRSHSNSGPAPDARPGSMRVGATPWCNVTVDGSSRGQTPVDISSISAGGHTVVCSNPAHGSQSQRITVEAGVQAIVRFRLP